MTKSVIIGQFTAKQIKRLIQSDTEIPFTTETDLTMVHWPLEDGQTDALKTPISEPGKKWVIAAQSDKDEILKIINETQCKNNHFPNYSPLSLIASTVTGSPNKSPQPVTNVAARG